MFGLTNLSLNPENIWSNDESFLRQRLSELSELFILTYLRSWLFNEGVGVSIPSNEAIVKIAGEIFRLSSAVNSATNETLLVRLCPRRTTVLTERLLHELRSEHNVEDATFLIDGTQWLHTALERCGLVHRHKTVDDRTAVERVYSGVKRRTSTFENIFRHADPAAAENWLFSHAAWQNPLK